MSIGPGYACVSCKTYFRPRKNGIYVSETMEDGRPYKVWQADLLECPDCGTQVIMGYGLHAISEHFMADFGTWHNLVTYTIIGCPRSLTY